MSIKDDYIELKEKHDILKAGVAGKMVTEVKKIISEFQKETGCVLTEISMEVLKHYKGIDCDMSVIVNVNIKTNIQEKEIHLRKKV